MSSILKALKKLEEQSFQEKESLPGPMHVKKAAAQEARELMLRRRILFIGVFTFALGIIGGAFWHRLPIGAVTGRNSVSDRLPGTGSVASLVRTDPIPPPQVRPEGKAAADPRPGAPEHLEPPSPLFREPASKDIVRTGPTTDAPAPPPVRPAAALQAPESTAAEGQMKALEDRRLDMQALTWSSDPEECFAVINNSIVRPGDSVEGFVVTRIGEDFVVVEQGSEQWALRFSVR